MKNYVLILLMAMFYSYQAPAHANPYLMDHETFRTLSEEQKNQIVIHMMGLVVELESKYQTETSENGFSQVRLEKFQKAITQIAEFLMASAHAQDDKAPNADFKKYSDQYTRIMTGAKSAKNTCVFAGWISKVVGGFCKHPKDIPNTKDPARLAYIDNSQVTKCPGTQISCNPAIYGFRSLKNKSLFCVETKAKPGEEAEAHNSSYNCMRYSLNHLDAKDPKQPGDSKEDRLSFLKAELQKESNRVAFDNIHGHVFDACLCDGKGNSSTLSATYRAYMKPHRTCFGLMYSLRSIHNGCEISEVGNPGFDQLNGFFQSWDKTDDFQIKRYKPKKHEVNSKKKKTDDEFGTQYGELVTNPEFQEKNCPYIKAETCTAKCGDEIKDEKGASKWECYVESYKRGVVDVDLSKVPKEKLLRTITDIKTKTVTYEKASCPVSVSKQAAEPDKYTCSAECTEKKEKDKKTGKWVCVLKEAKLGDKDILEEIKKLKKSTIVLDKEPADKVNFTHKAKDDMECSVTKIADNQCKITLTHNEKDGTVAAVVTYPTAGKEEKPVAVWGKDITALKPNEATFKWDGNSALTVEVTSEDKKYSCKEVLAPKPKSEKNSCKIIQGTFAEGKVKLNVIFTPLNKDDEPIEIDWYPPKADDESADSENEIDWNGESDKTVVVKAKAKGKDGKTLEEFKCDLKLVPKKEEANPFDIKIKGGDLKDESKKAIVTEITVVVDGKKSEPFKDGKIPPGYTVEWIRDGADDLEFDTDVVVEEEKKKDDGLTEISEDNLDEKPKTAPEIPEKPAVKKPIAGTDKEIVAKRMPEHSYGVCAVLIEDKTGKEVARSNCIKVPKTPAPYTPAPINGPPRQYRQKIDTWTGEKR